jgi:hypothetical protein
MAVDADADVQAYLDAVPPERRAFFDRVRRLAARGR